MKKIPKNKIYNRFMFPIKFKNGYICEYRNYLSILDKIIMYINEQEINIPKVENYFLNSFPILLDCLNNIQINFIFYKNGNIINIENKGGKIIGGFLPKTISEYCFVNDKVIYSGIYCKPVRKLIKFK